MKTLLRAFLAFSFVLVPVAACGGGSGSPSSPSMPPPPPSSATITVASNLTGTPLAGATVAIGGQAVVTNAAGQAVFSSIAPGAAVDVTAGDYITQNTTLKSAADTVYLIPGSSAWVPVVFNPYVPSSKLTRPAAGTTIFLRPNPEILADPGSMSTLGQVAELATTVAAQNRNPYVVTSTPSAGANTCDVLIDPSQGFAGLTTSRFSGNLMTCVKISLLALGVSRNITPMLHELGHTMGLGHQEDPSYLMHPGAGAYGLQDFNGYEKFIVAAMSAVYRPTGTSAPDNQRTGVAGTAVPVTVRVDQEGDEYVILITNTSDEALHGLTVSTKFEGALYRGAKVASAGRASPSGVTTFSPTEVSALSYMPSSSAGAIRMRVAQLAVGSGRFTVTVTDASGKSVSEPSGLVTIACGQ